MTAAYCTLGCKVSQYETQAIRTLMEQAGFVTVPFNDVADVYVINSCTVTATGDKKSRQMVHRARRQNAHAVTVLCGCYPQASPEESAKESTADIVLGTIDRAKVPELVQDYLHNKSRIVHIKSDIRHEHYENIEVDRLDEHTRAYIKIEDGCDRFCSYCLVPFARGNIRSRTISDIESEARRLTSNGYKEIVLIGINLSAYKTQDGGDLVDAALAVVRGGARRVRFGSLEPELLTPDMIHRLSLIPELCRQFHLSLQSGSDSVLRRMNRRYSCDEYAEIVNNLRTAMPDCAITTDIMVGFPGETDTEFEETLTFASNIGFASAHIFIYSRRNGTVAAAMSDQIAPEIGKMRSKALAAQIRKSKEKYMQSRIGTAVELLMLEQTDERILCVAKDGCEAIMSSTYGIMCKNNTNSIVSSRIIGVEDGKYVVECACIK